jgi:transcription-repair coupling factor (superfamily II helicase)
MRDFPITQQDTSPLHHVSALLSRSSKNCGIYGLVGSAPGLFIAAAITEGARPIVQIFPDGDSAAAAAEDVCFYLGRETGSVHPLKDEVLHYPSSDAFPYSGAAFETDVSVIRVADLYRLSEATPPRYLSVGLDALIRRVVPRSDFRRTSFSLQVGEEIDRDDLLEGLVAAGYRRAPLVEEPGDFSVRGFIVDLYPPFYPYPVRLEQMGDQIESMRFFDPSNQRSKDDVQEIEVGPIQMLIPDKTGLERGIKEIKQACEDRGVEKRIRQRLIEDFSHGVRFPGAEFYLPYFSSQLETLLDYMPGHCNLLLPDHETLTRAFEELEEDISRGWENAAKGSMPVPSPDRVYLTQGEFFRQVEKFRTVTISPLEIEEPGRAGIRVECGANADIRHQLLKSGSHDTGMAGLVNMLEQWRDNGSEVFLVSRTQSQANRLLKLLEPYPLSLDFRGEGFEPSNLISAPTPGIRLYVGGLSAGFRMEELGRIAITEEEIFGAKVRSMRRQHARGSQVSTLNDLAEGESVVHEDYGLGIFRGLTIKEFDDIPNEVMVIEYAGGDLLYHPVERLQVIQKYIAGSDGPARIDKLGGKGWAKTKAKVKRSIREMAEELLTIFAKRKLSQRPAYSALDENMAAFEASFAFEETPDQAKAIQDIMEAMDTDRPMDRLVCGDVGYGKTEVAFRAAFRAILDNKQVAILVPTTVLAQQHFDTALSRFKEYPLSIELLSRFRTGAQQKKIVKGLEEGKYDLIIGTHRLLGKDVSFKNLGLMVVDEEQRFGVTHKEKIKKYKSQIDVLTLTATPIPRTLHLSLTGIRDLSLIETAPSNRKSIRTHVMRQSEDVIRDALTRELARGGQVFYIHNRVRTIFRRATRLNELVPEGSIGVAHGQMPEKDLERVMLEFVQGRFNILVSTSIIESGLDIPRANTIIIERADTFGLADLYQLRGRVGRSSVRAYAYLLTPPDSLMTPDAIKRLAVIQEHSSLGQGFRIAMRDLEIRGAGNILGSAQSGHVALVGYEMYLDLLEEAVQEIKGNQAPPKIDPEIRLKMETRIPDGYVPDPQQRMGLYKRLSRAEDNAEINRIEDEIIDLYGKQPQQVENLLGVMRVRVGLKTLRIVKLDYNGKDLVVTFDADTPVNPDFLIALAQNSPKKVRFLPRDRVAFFVGKNDPQELVHSCFRLIETLEQSPGNHGDSEED